MYIYFWRSGNLADVYAAYRWNRLAIFKAARLTCRYQYEIISSDSLSIRRWLHVCVRIYSAMIRPAVWFLSSLCDTYGSRSLPL